MNEMKCENCKFWDGWKDNRDSNPDYGFCRINPPNIICQEFLDTFDYYVMQSFFKKFKETIPPPHNRWPTTSKDDWCGQFKKKEEF